MSLLPLHSTVPRYDAESAGNGKMMLVCSAVMAACVGTVFLIQTTGTQSALYAAPVATMNRVATTPSAVVKGPMTRSIMRASQEPVFYNQASTYESATPYMMAQPASPAHTAGMAALSMSVMLAVAGIAMKISSFFGKSETIAMATAAGTRKTHGRVCAILGKEDNRKARNITFSHKTNKTVQKVNLQWRRLYWEEGNCWVRLRLSTKGWKTIQKYGLHAAARKFGVDLNNYKNGTSARKYTSTLPQEEQEAAKLRLNKNVDQVGYRTVMGEASNKMTGKAFEPETIAMFTSHGKKMPKLQLPADQRKALLRALTTELIRHGRIKTTLIRGKAMRKHVDHMITLAKDGSLHARRQAMGYLYDKALVHALFEQVPERYGDRNGGYTRIVRTMSRRGDNCKMCYIELV